LGLGEHPALNTPYKHTNTLLILDDGLARKQALRKQLVIVGTAALLFAAQRKSLIAGAEDVIAELNKVG